MASDLTNAAFVYLSAEYKNQIFMIVQTYIGAVSVKTRHAKRIAGAAHSKCPLFR